MTVHSMYNSVITTCVLGTDLLGVLRKCWDRVSLCNLGQVRTFLKPRLDSNFPAFCLSLPSAGVIDLHTHARV